MVTQVSSAMINEKWPLLWHICVAVQMSCKFWSLALQFC